MNSLYTMPTKLEQGWQTAAHGLNLVCPLLKSLPLVFVNQALLEINQAHSSCIIHVCFHTTAAEVNSCNRLDGSQNLNYLLFLYRVCHSWLTIEGL